MCGWGGYAEYVSVPENAIALKPANLTFEEAAAVPESALSSITLGRRGIVNKQDEREGERWGLYPSRIDWRC